MQTKDDEKMAQALVEAYEKLKSQVQQVIVGQDGVLEQLLIAMLARGHCLLEGVPGIGKDTHGAIIGSSNQPEFPPDTISPPILCPPILPAPTSFRKTKPPVTVNLSLKKVRSFPKSYWRTKSIGLPPKTQAALLEAMQEHDVSVGGKTYHLEEPFSFSPLKIRSSRKEPTTCPKLKRDRFLFQVIVDYPSRDEERQIIERTTSTFESKLEPVLDGKTILECQSRQAGTGSRTCL